MSRSKKTADTIQTKEKIILEAVKLFATKGYGAVSIRDIAKTVGIKGASLYSHFESKEHILEEALLQFSQGYKVYFERSIAAIEEESTLEGVMDVIFAELDEVVDISSYYWQTLIFREQFNNKLAREMAFQLFYTDTIYYIQSHFEGLAKKGVIAPFDSKALATCLMFCMVVGTELRIHESMGAKTPIDCTEMYGYLRHFFTNAVRAGITGEPEPEGQV